MKYALLHCSYSAPVRVEVITSDTVSIVAARETVFVGAAAVRAESFVVTGRLVATRDGVVARVIVCAERAVTRDVFALARVGDDMLLFDCAVRETTGVVAVRPDTDVFARPVTARLDATRDAFCNVLSVVRLVAFSSRTAALATPMQTINTAMICKIFFIPDSILAKLQNSGQVFLYNISIVLNVIFIRMISNLSL